MYVCSFCRSFLTLQVSVQTSNLARTLGSASVDVNEDSIGINGSLQRTLPDKTILAFSGGYGFPTEWASHLGVNLALTKRSRMDVGTSIGMNGVNVHLGYFEASFFPLGLIS